MRGVEPEAGEVGGERDVRGGDGLEARSEVVEGAGGCEGGRWGCAGGGRGLGEGEGEEGEGEEGDE